MGLFDRFGAGGGKLELHPNSRQLGPGQTLDGRVSFVSGTRAQAITNITLKLTQTTHYYEQTPQGPQQRSRSNDVVPAVLVTGAFTTTPGDRHDFPFAIVLPPMLQSTAPQQCSYRLSVAADIDNEIDPGSGIEIQIVGGTTPQPMMGAMPGQPMMGGMPGQPMMGGMPGQPMMGGMPGQPMMGGMPGQPMMGGMPGQPMTGGMPGQAIMGTIAGLAGAVPGMSSMPAVPGPVGVGSRVLAQWQDGQFHPGTVVQAANGYFAIDWENPSLGATTWVAPQQVQVAPMMGGMPGQPMMGGMPGQPMMGGMPGQPMMGGMPGQPMMGGMPGQPMQPTMGQPMTKAPMAPGGALGVGTLVYAAGPDGQLHPGRIVAQQNGYHAVDWDNPKLGATAWVADHQIKPR